MQVRCPRAIRIRATATGGDWRIRRGTGEPEGQPGAAAHAGTCARTELAAARLPGRAAEPSTASSLLTNTSRLTSSVLSSSCGPALCPTTLRAYVYAVAWAPLRSHARPGPARESRTEDRSEEPEAGAPSGSGRLAQRRAWQAKAQSRGWVRCGGAGRHAGSRDVIAGPRRAWRLAPDLSRSQRACLS